MKQTRRDHLIFILFNLMLFTGLGAQGTYHDYRSLSEKIRNLERSYPKLCSVQSLAATAGGKEILVLTIGGSQAGSKPAIAVFGNTGGGHILGRELSAGFAEKLLDDSGSPATAALLEKITFYVFPDISPDASEQFFSGLKYERKLNARPVDDDRDFVTDEDGFEDLNNDGLITLLRVKDKAGSFVRSSEDERIMVKADPAKGEGGEYLLITEGIDNDGDGSFNEDGPGGVDFDMNFPFGYEFFSTGSGSYPVSEPETEAVAAFLFSRFNIFAVFTFGPGDNLGQPWKAGQADEKSPVIKSLLKDDEPIGLFLSEKYHQLTGVKGAPYQKAGHGNFLEWLYFDYGRYSFGTPAWWFPCEKDSDPGLAFMKYADKAGNGSAFIPWTVVSHPAFQGKTAEVGGIKPFALTTPPADSLAGLINRNYRFISAMAALHPEPEFTDIKTENAGEGIWRVTLKLHNKGFFGTMPEIAADNIYVRTLRITLDLSAGQTLLSGHRVEDAGRLGGNQAKEFSWLVRGHGQVRLTAGALNTGTVTTEIELR